MARDPRTMTSKGRPGSGLATGAARLKQVAAVKKAKQANGAKPNGYDRKTPKAKSKKAASVKRPAKKAYPIPGKTTGRY